MEGGRHHQEVTLDLALTRDPGSGSALQQTDRAHGEPITN